MTGGLRRTSASSAFFGFRLAAPDRCQLTGALRCDSHGDVTSLAAFSPSLGGVQAVAVPDKPQKNGGFDKITQISCTSFYGVRRKSRC